MNEILNSIYILYFLLNELVSSRSQLYEIVLHDFIFVVRWLSVHVRSENFEVLHVVVDRYDLE